MGAPNTPQVGPKSTTRPPPRHPDGYIQEAPETNQISEDRLSHRPSAGGKQTNRKAPSPKQTKKGDGRQFRFVPPYAFDQNPSAESSRTTSVGRHSNDASALQASPTEKQSRKEIEKRSQNKLQDTLNECKRSVSTWRKHYPWIQGAEASKGSADAVQYLMNIESDSRKRLQQMEERQKKDASDIESSKEKEKQLLDDCQSKDREIASQAQKIKSLEERLADLETEVASLRLDASSSNALVFEKDVSGFRIGYDESERMIVIPEEVEESLQIGT
ncbi:hypothetical protein SISSUDRAFT_1131231 [Sistotremastrum suecicum HHB10207 ss-3]|uniref:Uncharacterized protein n=1 Tax=Sistotremastrum suecicum HHB10207 ss-3 TaxID=1314776 RepID=A0A166AGB1_9AGAM|nr:hypothetical protein SISSUDRAFT_1131231 [Sistotremastrum suecicum HHB10207 ss-3]